MRNAEKHMHTFTNEGRNYVLTTTYHFANDYDVAEAMWEFVADDRDIITVHGSVVGNAYTTTVSYAIMLDGWTLNVTDTTDTTPIRNIYGGLSHGIKVLAHKFVAMVCDGGNTDAMYGLEMVNDIMAWYHG